MSYSPLKSHLQTAPLLMILPSSALQRPQDLAGSAAQELPDTFTTPFLLNRESSARSRLKQNNIKSGNTSS